MRVVQSTAVTNTPEFRRWFGDSKIREDDGQPMVVYHGTNASRTEFRPGTYFTAVRGQAQDYANTATEMDGGHPTVIAVYLSLQNPAVVHDDYIEWAGSEVAEIEKQKARATTA